MKQVLIIGIVAMVIAVSGCSITGNAVAEVEETQVQQAMDDFIKAKLVREGGTYSIEDRKTEFDYLHDGVNLNDDGLYISCADFKDGEDVIDVDYYVQVQDGKYEVVKEVFHKLNGEKVNSVLWEK